MAPSAINATVKPSMKLNNTTSRQVISSMRVTIVPNMAVRGVGSAKYNVVNVNAQNASRSANIVAMSASSSNAGNSVSNQLGAKAQYSNFSLPSSNNNYNMGLEGISMNSNTSKWGKQMGASSFNNNELVENMNSMAMKSKGMNMNSQLKARLAQCGDYSFNVAGASMSV